MKNEIEFIDLDTKINNKSKKSKILFIIIGVVLVIAMLLCTIYFIVLSPKRTFTKFTNELKSEIKELLSINSEKTSILIKEEEKVTKAPIELSTLNDLKINNLIGIDTINKRALLQVDLNYSQLQLAIKYFLEDGISYIEAPNLLPVVTKIDSKEIYDEIFNKDSIKIDNIIDSIFDGFIDSYNEKNVKRTLNISNIRLTYILDEKEINNIKNKVLDNISNDKNAISEIKNLLDINDEELKELIDELKQENIEMETITIIVEYNIFNKKISKINIYNSTDSIVFSNNKKIISLDIILKDDDYNFTLNANITNDNKINGEINITQNNITTNVILQGNVKLDNNNLMYEGKTNIILDTNNPNDIIEIESNCEVKINESFDGIDTSKSKYLEEYTEEELINVLYLIQALKESFSSNFPNIIM